MASNNTQNKNPQAVRPNMLWLLSTTSLSTSNLHFVLSALVRPAFLLFLQHTKLVLKEPDPDSWSLHLLFPLPGNFSFTEVSASFRTAFSDSSIEKALSQSPSFPLICYNFSKYLCHFFTLRICSFLVFSNKIISSIKVYLFLYSQGLKLGLT